MPSGPRWKRQRRGKSDFVHCGGDFCRLCRAAAVSGPPGADEPGETAEPLEQGVGHDIGVLAGVRQVKENFQRLMVGQALKALLGNALPHPFAVPLMEVVFCSHGSFSFFSGLLLLSYRIFGKRQALPAKFPCQSPPGVVL